jgi:hypothetical protein
MPPSASQRTPRKGRLAGLLPTRKSAHAKVCPDRCSQQHRREAGKPLSGRRVLTQPYIACVRVAGRPGGRPQFPREQYPQGTLGPTSWPKGSRLQSALVKLWFLPATNRPVGTPLQLPHVYPVVYRPESADHTAYSASVYISTLQLPDTTLYTIYSLSWPYDDVSHSIVNYEILPMIFLKLN